MRQASAVKTRLSFIIGVLITFLTVGVSFSEPTQGTGRWSILGAGEYWGDSETPGHIIALVAWSQTLSNRSTLAVEYNTDTLRLEWDKYRVRSGLDLGARLTGQVAIANLLSDYFVDGAIDPERGFYASYVAAQTWLKLNPIDGVYVQLELGGRRWFFSPTPKTSDALRLPNDSWVFEPRLFLTWWRLKGDKAWADRHRLFPRLRGIATGIYGGVNLLDSPRSWGGLVDEDHPDFSNRNRPESFQVFVVQWLKAGRHIFPRLRWQLKEESGWSMGEDDIYRRTVGGLNPYVVIIPGVPWAYFHSGDYASVETSLAVHIAGDVEMGPLVGMTYLRDIDRRGRDDFAAVWGAGGHLDARVGAFQIDVRAGYSPTLSERYVAAGGWSAFVSVGYEK